jgi:hypothetical protein
VLDDKGVRPRLDAIMARAVLTSLCGVSTLMLMAMDAPLRFALLEPGFLLGAILVLRTPTRRAPKHAMTLLVLVTVVTIGSLLTS